MVLAGNRILTNAHVVNHASQISVQPDKSTEKISASIVAIAPGIDLALLRLDDPSFFESHPPIPPSTKLPAIQETVLVYGYPEGGSELAVTRGIVSRLEFAEYYLNVEGLRVQVDAAVNPGNSGGPVVADAHLIGIVFSKLERADNIGYIIPMEEINLFLEDIKDGRYDGKCILPARVQFLENPALRARLKLDKHTSGVIIRKINRLGPSYALREGDLLISIDGHDIDNYMITPSGPSEVDTPKGMIYSANPIYTRYGDRPAFSGERIVIVGLPVFSHKISKGYADPYSEAVAQVNGVAVKKPPASCRAASRVDG